MTNHPQTVVDAIGFRYFLEADRIALHRRTPRLLSKGWLAQRLFPDHVWEFQKTLRRLEFLHNRPQNLWVKVRRLLVYRRYLALSFRLNFTIPPNVFGPGLAISHRGTIVVNTGATVGANCRLHTCVNIGTEAGQSRLAPRIGNNVYIGPGAKIYGDIMIADGCAIGANAVVNKSFEEPGSLIAGVPANRIGEIDTGTLLIKATEVLARSDTAGNET